MKLIIRDEEPKEETCEIWVERYGDDIRVMSRFGDDFGSIELVLGFNMLSHRVHGNFKWEEE